jgi:glycosyltransferase involved in cell wall biosynthesis
MTEGSILPPDWADTINNSGVERVIVPCQHNADAFANSGVTAPISVVHGGTDPAEFPLRTEPRDAAKPYTFLTFADRNERKGWHEVWDAFYLAFGGKTTGTMDVRLLIKYRPDDNNVTTVMAGAVDADKRIVYQGEDVADMAMLYAQADCLVLPSRSEGWGMIHREAACQGLPVITQAYSGLSDAHEWAIVVEKGVMQPIPRERSTSLGEWRVVDVAELAQKMRWCYERPTEAAEFGRQAAAWIRDNQTWTHAASALIDLLNASEVTTQDMHAAYA